MNLGGSRGKVYGSRLQKKHIGDQASTRHTLKLGMPSNGVTNHQNSCKLDGCRTESDKMKWVMLGLCPAVEADRLPASGKKEGRLSAESIKVGRKLAKVAHIETFPRLHRCALAPKRRHRTLPLEDCCIFGAPLRFQFSGGQNEVRRDFCGAFRDFPTDLGEFSGKLVSGSSQRLHFLHSPVKYIRVSVCLFKFFCGGEQVAFAVSRKMNMKNSVVRVHDTK
ncbi:hypothetical protein WA026_001420 [Henosepilachna vigintioctopunctata]|uniref:Uncharacterized protein n=1 Tax=Henosepilachna vigintioctopunctata TaxID=420089 RepID=A0AAW1UTS8_9CUCU